MSWVPLEDSFLSLSPSLLGSFGTCSSVARGSTTPQTHKIDPDVPVAFLLTFRSSVYLLSTFPVLHCTFASTLIIDLFCIFFVFHHAFSSAPFHCTASHRLHPCILPDYDYHIPSIMLAPVTCYYVYPVTHGTHRPL